MQRWRRILMVIVAALVAVQASVHSAAACSCVDPGPPATAFSVMPAVFVGTVKSVTLGNGVQARIDELRSLMGLPSLFFSGGPHITLTVRQAWKGVTSTEVVVVTGGSGASCGSDFQLRQDYVVYAWPDTYGLTTNACTRTAAVSAATADLAYLQSQPTLALATASSMPVAVTVGLALAAMVAAVCLGVAVIWRLRRPKLKDNP